ncbi:MAG: DUF4340 domain-containing protein [Myxococcota bacterium]
MNKTAIFWSLACLVLAVAYVVTRDQGTSAAGRQFQPPTLQESEIDRVELLGRSNVTLTRRRGRWWLHVPTEGSKEKKEEAKQVPADAKSVADLLRALRELKHDYLMTEHVEKHAECGLGEPPKGSIRLFKRDKPVWTARVGDAVGGGFARRYVCLPNAAEVFVVKGAWWILGLESGEIERWRDRSVFGPVRAAAVSKVIVRPAVQEKKRKGEAAVVELHAQGEDDAIKAWRVVQPKQPPPDYRLDGALVDRLVQNLAELRAQRFVEDEAGRRRAMKQFQDRPLGTVELVLRNSKRYALRLARWNEDVIGQLIEGSVSAPDGEEGKAAASPIYVLRPGDAEALLPDLPTLRDWAIWRLPPAKVREVTVHEPGQEAIRLEYMRRDEWSLKSPQGASHYIDLDKQRVWDHVQRLSVLTASGLAPLAQHAGLRARLRKEGTLLRLVVKHSPNQELRLLKAGSEQGEQLYYAVREQGDDAPVYMLPAREDDLWVRGLSTLESAKKE